MSKKSKSNADYAKKARKLRTFGFHTSYSKANNSPQFKSAVTRAWSRSAFYVVNAEKNRIEFKKFGKGVSRNNVSDYVSPEQIAPGGFWIQRPKGVEKGQWKFKPQKDGTVKIYTKGSKAKVNDILLRLDVTELAIDSKAEFERLLEGKKRPRQILLTVNGFEAGQSHENLERFNRYVEEELIPHLQEAEFDFDAWGDKIFGMRLVYSSKGEKKAEHEGEQFDFSTGSIFEADSKKVYGKRKFAKRKKYIVKKGKRKGT